MGKSKTSKFYAKNPKSAAKHSCDNSSGCNGKYAHTKKYKNEHYKQRKKLKCKKNQDVVKIKSGKRKGKWRCESLKINRRRGGAKRK